MYACTDACIYVRVCMRTRARMRLCVLAVCDFGHVCMFVCMPASVLCALTFRILYPSRNRSSAYVIFHAISVFFFKHLLLIGAVTPSQFAGRLLANPSADCHKIVCVGWVGWAIYACLNSIS